MSERDGGGRGGRALRGMQAPDLWPRIEEALLEPGAAPAEGDRRQSRRAARQRILAGAVAFVVLGAGIAFAWTALGRGPRGDVLRPPPPTSPQPLPTVPRVTVGAVFKGAQARCEASLLTPVVRPGQTPVVEFRLTNEGSSPVRYGEYQDYVEVKDGTGHTLASWLDKFGGVPPPLPAPMVHMTLKPGKAARFAGTDEPVVRWAGPLSIHLTCPFVIGSIVHRPTGDELDMLASPTLPPLPLQVFAPGSAPGIPAAVDRAVAAEHGLFDSCRPGPDGSAVDGTIVPPEVPKPPKVLPAPMQARCWATIERNPGFDQVTLWFVTPPDAVVATPADPEGTVQLPHLPTVEIYRAGYVVTYVSAIRAFGFHSGSSATATVGFDWAKGHWRQGDLGCGPESYFGSLGVTFPVAENPC
jgi:hypothetical protein